MILQLSTMPEWGSHRWWYIGAEPYFLFTNFTKYHDRIGINTSLLIIVGTYTMIWFHVDKHLGDASVFVTLKPSNSLPTVTSKSVLIP